MSAHHEELTSVPVMKGTPEALRDALEDRCRNRVPTTEYPALDLTQAADLEQLTLEVTRHLRNCSDLLHGYSRSEVFSDSKGGHPDLARAGDFLCVWESGPPGWAFDLEPLGMRFPDWAKALGVEPWALVFTDNIRS